MLLYPMYRMIEVAGITLPRTYGRCGDSAKASSEEIVAERSGGGL
jgi:hypothetical protein